MFFTYVREVCERRGRMEFLPDEVDAVYESEMLGTRGHAELTHYEERLKLVLGEEIFPLALDMLTEAAVAGCLTGDALEALQAEYQLERRTVADAQKEVLWVLEHDGYLKPGSGGYVFESHVIRDWWKARHELFFTPVLKRGG